MRIARLVVFGSVVCVFVSLAVNYLLLFDPTLTSFGRSLVSAIVLPIVLGAPLLYFIGLKLREIGRFRRDLNRAATYDAVTDCFRGAAFSSAVDRRAAPETGHGPRRGAFLLVDAEHLRSINMRYGFDWGEEALRVIASTIRASVRAEDIVGRVGEGEFAVFLPGASEDNAREVGERIRGRLAKAVLLPEADGDLLDVSVGGVTFEGAPVFEEMFRAAGEKLSDAHDAREVILSRFEPAGSARPN
jgi:diguanylate cyclase (GGDEF)-like protein